MTEKIAPPPAWRQGVLHSNYARIAVGLVNRLGLHVEAALPETARMLPFLDLLPYLEAFEAARNPMRGIALGLSIPASAHGAMGYAAVSSATIGQALAAIAEFTPMRNRILDYACQVTAKETVLTFTPRIPLYGYREFVEIATVITVCKTVQSLAGDDAAQRMQFDASWSDTAELPMPMQVRHGRPVSALRVPADIALLPTLTADAKLYASASRSCEEELTILNGSVAARLRAIMPNADQTWPSLTEAAQQFSMSPRTLIRKLQQEEMSYQSVLDEAKSEMACWYLRNTAIPLSGIAERLGFVDDSNFSRSFKRWRGITPLKYRMARQVRNETTDTGS
ncbi:MAG: helix-turn-helix domain-containing protein [Rhodoferax sp.]|nr:helix-turn-helix domain-containing protein [Rhodoferax sp.]